MKMKKTQSLKLMLVGLLCSMGMSAWAANGDIFTDKKLVLQEVNGKAQVIAVASHNGTIVIPDEVQNSFDNDKTLKVSRIQQGWWAGGQLVLKRDGGQEIAGSTVAKNLLNGGGFILKIEATQLYDITMQEIVPVNGKITQFIVDAAAGLNMLPEHAFQKNQTVVDEVKTAANQAAHDAAVAKAEAALAGKDEEVCFIKDGQYDGKQVYTAGGKYYIQGETAEATYGDKTWNEVLEITVDGETEATEYVSRINSNNGKMYVPKFTNDAYDGVMLFAVPYEGDVCINVHTNSPAENVAAAEAAVELADQQVTAAHQATVDAEYAAAHPNTQVTQEQLDKKAAAERLEAAILAFQENKSWSSLQKRIAMKTGTNVTLVDAWTAAYVLANDPDNTLLQLTKPDQWAPLTEEFIEAYEEFYGKEPRIVSEMQVQSYTFNSFGAAGDEAAAAAASGAAQLATTSGFTFTPWANGLVEDRSQYDNYDVTAQAAGYYQIKVLENSVEGFVNNYYYVKVAPDAIDENTYYVLYQKDDLDAFVPVGEKDASDNYTSIAVVKIAKGELMTVARVLPVPTEIDAFNPSNDIRAAIAAGTADQDALDEAAEAARQAEAEAIVAAAKAALALADAEQALADAQAALEAAENAPVETVYKFEFGGNNDWLTNVQWDNDGIANFGAYCFKDCVNANFKNNGTAGLFPSVTVNIGEEAFLNCKKLDADLQNTNATIANIGNAAFMNTKTTTVALENATKLGDSNIGVNVWDNTPMVTINLLNTNLTQMPEGLAEDIQRGAEAKDCNNKPVTYSYTYENEDGETVTATKTATINSTLTTVVMPKNSNKVRDINFWFCENLNSLTMPAGIASIGEYAFAGTALTELDLTDMKDLTYVGDGAFAFNEALTSVKFAEEAPFTNLEGDVFRCDYSLEEIELNDSVKCLPAGLFADTQIKKLDLSKTQVTVLPDLFWGSADKVTASQTEPNVCSTLTEILLPETVMNATNDKVEIPGLQVIGNHAFAFLQGITEMTIPSSVWAMGTEVFAYDMNLKEVTAMDSRLTNLGVNTFRNCNKLEKFTFVTLNVINPAWTFAGDPRSEEAFADYCGNEVELGGVFNFDDTQFFNCPKVPELVLTDESIDIIKGQFFKSFAEEYSKLTAYQPTITLTDNGTNFSSTYYNEDYGTWIPVDEVLGVYTAYQNVNEMILYKAKRHNNYYKIPALRSYTTEDDEDGTLISWNETDALSTSGYWFSKGWDQENTFVYTANDGPITEIAQGSPAVIIIADKETINVKRVSRPGEKYQSTLDRDNELRIAGCTLTPDITSNLCVWATDYESLHTFYILQDPAAVVARGKVVFPLSAWQGTANGRLNVTIVDSDVTGIMSAKDYVKSLNDSEAIYTLQGVRVSTPVKGQLYIQGGKKFIQK